MSRPPLKTYNIVCIVYQSMSSYVLVYMSLTFIECIHTQYDIEHIYKSMNHIDYII